MKRIKGVVFALIGLFIAITLLSLLMPSRVMTARSVVIHAPAEKIEPEVADLQNWSHWHPVFMHPDSKLAISSPSKGVNAFATWNTNGKINKMTITEAIPGAIKLRLARAGENDIENMLTVSPVTDSIAMQVEWRVLTKLKWYPWEKFYGIFLDKLTGPGYEQALEALKQRVESEP